jgi:hypothetical protein
MIFVHIGLHKTGTTFLQQHFFPRWPTLQFYHKTVPLREVLAAPTGQKVLISNEGLWCGGAYRQPPGDAWWAALGDRRVQAESIARLREFFPEARVLVSFRRHSDLILSLYLQYVQKGGTLPLKKFFDVDGDGGLLGKQSLSFRHVIETIDETFTARPFIFLQEDLRDDLEGTLRCMGDYFECPPPEIPQKALSGRAKKHAKARNRSVGHHQAKILRALNRVTYSDHNPRGWLPLRSRTAKRLGLHARRLCQYGLLARLLPYRRVVLDENIRRQIDDYYRDDWEFVNNRKAGEPDVPAVGAAVGRPHCLAERRQGART